MKLLFYNLKINIWISSDSTQSTTLNFLNCLFFDKMLLIFSYFSPKIFFNLSCHPNCLFSKYFCSFPSKAWLLPLCHDCIGSGPWSPTQQLLLNKFFPSFNATGSSRLWMYHALFFSWSSFNILFLYGFFPCASQSEMQLPCQNGMSDPECARASSGQLLSQAVHRHAILGAVAVCSDEFL